MNNFLQDYPVYYINIDSREDRNNYILEHFKNNNIYNFNRVSAFTSEKLSENNIKESTYLGINKKEMSTVFSHLMAIESFLNNSDKKYALICEDDADLSILKKVNFNVDSLFSHFKLDVQCIQLSVNTREDAIPNFKIRLRSHWDFCCASYLITREYAEKIVSYYKNKEGFNLLKYQPSRLLEYRNNKIFISIPVAESVIYGMTDTIVCPLVTFVITESSIDGSNEKNRQITKSRDDFYDFWDKYNYIEMVDLIA